KKRNIECSIHYPRPPHKQKAFLEYAQLELPITEKIHERVISLPMSPVLQNEEVQFVIDALNNY
ncbi:MAG: DegT/DnrJ/EryC1/StrS family aminotransferase, partial [Bacteroidia bacterium]|nr:DegT/DnrJ/EryC1/StrS family aminotransferase [Bacteroidia bacterium]